MHFRNSAISIFDMLNTKLALKRITLTANQEGNLDFKPSNFPNLTEINIFYSPIYGANNLINLLHRIMEESQKRNDQNALKSNLIEYININKNETREYKTAINTRGKRLFQKLKYLYPTIKIKKQRDV